MEQSASPGDIVGLGATWLLRRRDVASQRLYPLHQRSRFNTSPPLIENHHVSLSQPLYRIESARYRDWDYAAEAWYFVTACTGKHACCFGKVSDTDVRLTPLGSIAHQCLHDIPQHFTNAIIDDFCVMPNHVHAIIVIDRRVDTAGMGPAAAAMETLHSNVSTAGGDAMSRISPKPGSLSAIMRSYKSTVTQWAHDNNYPFFAWQPRFHDHIIRNEKDLQRIRQYIHDDPLRSEMDRHHQP